MIPLLVVLPMTVEGNREEMCELRHASLLVQKMQVRAEVSRLADAKAASRGMQRPTSAYRAHPLWISELFARPAAFPGDRFG